jgi:hypothetical protein
LINNIRTNGILYENATNNMVNNAIESNLGNKAEKDLSNIPDNYDYVIETKTPAVLDSTWYRKYKSGWVEQGGNFSASSTNYLVQLPIEMANIYYSVQATVNDASISKNNIPYYLKISLSSGRYTTTYFTIFVNKSTSTTDFTVVDLSTQVIWEVKGMAA